MFGNKQGGARAYANVGLETGAANANPHELIVMLFDGALVAISTVLQELEDGGGRDVAKKATAITKATRIINEGLRASLDQSAGSLATQLDALYHYIGTELILANSDNDAIRMRAAKDLLSGLSDAWKAIPPEFRVRQPAEGLAA